MLKDLLLEIGTEELPSRFVRDAVNQLADKTAKWLTDTRIGYQSVHKFATPRRLAVLIKGVSPKQEDVAEEVKGPSKKIALDEKGNWTKAALGFARSQGVDPDKLYFKEIGGVDYVHALKQSAGVESTALLPEGLSGIIQSLTFPKQMRWGSGDMKFARPIKWLVALYGTDIVPFEIAGIRSGRRTAGHRFLGDWADLAAANDYAETLRQQFVIADMDEREAMIRSQIQSLADSKGWHIQIQDDLMEEVLFLVEYPTVLYGSFHPDFLDIPKEVLITSMREHQRYFPVFDQEGKLLPHFVTVRNGNADHLENVIRGNEKVLRARLSDAKFFYTEDQKLPIETALSRLEHVVFHEELGTLGDKVRRIGRIAEELAKREAFGEQDRQYVQRAAEICKFDLMTQMVYEFPELQGVMGEDYARKAGEAEPVAKAVFEHYLPRFAGDKLPETNIGAIVSIADKLDTIVGCFSIGIVPTGSQDPYALRRQANGIVQIILEYKFSFTLSDLFRLALDVHEAARPLKRSREDVLRDLNDFFVLRVKNVLSDMEIRYDLVDAVILASAGIDHVPGTIRRALALQEAVADGAFKQAVDAFNRVCNLAVKATSKTVNPEVFVEPAEQALYQAWQACHAGFAQAMNEGREQDALRTLMELEAPINAFFDAVLVMVEDEAVRQNRLGLLATIAADIKALADFSKLVW